MYNVAENVSVNANIFARAFSQVLSLQFWPNPYLVLKLSVESLACCILDLECFTRVTFQCFRCGDKLKE